MPSATRVFVVGFVGALITPCLFVKCVSSLLGLVHLACLLSVCHLC